jgi:hypothetical protein
MEGDTVEVVIVEIDGEAGVTVRAEGVAGPGCRTLTAGIEASLGRTTGDRPTPELYQEAPADAGLAAGRR